MPYLWPAVQQRKRNSSAYVKKILHHRPGRLHARFDFGLSDNTLMFSHYYSDVCSWLRSAWLILHQALSTRPAYRFASSRLQQRAILTRSRHAPFISHCRVLTADSSRIIVPGDALSWIWLKSVRALSRLVPHGRTLPFGPYPSNSVMFPPSSCVSISKWMGDGLLQGGSITLHDYATHYALSRLAWWASRPCATLLLWLRSSAISSVSCSLSVHDDHHFTSCGALPLQQSS